MTRDRAPWCAASSVVIGLLVVTGLFEIGAPIGLSTDNERLGVSIRTGARC